jgi:hypothetical protein
MSFFHTSIFELSAYYYCNKIWKELESRKRSIIAWKLCIYILASYFMIHGVKKLIIKLCFHFVQCKQKNKWKSVVFSVILTAFLSRRFLITKIQKNNILWNYYANWNCQIVCCLNYSYFNLFLLNIVPLTFGSNWQSRFWGEDWNVKS